MTVQLTVIERAVCQLAPSKAPASGPPDRSPRRGCDPAELARQGAHSVLLWTRPCCCAAVSYSRDRLSTKCSLLSSTGIYEPRSGHQWPPHLADLARASGPRSLDRPVNSPLCLFSNWAIHEPLSGHQWPPSPRRSLARASGPRSLDRPVNSPLCLFSNRAIHEPRSGHQWPPSPRRSLARASGPRSLDRPVNSPLCLFSNRAIHELRKGHQWPLTWADRSREPPARARWIGP